ncbi:MAG: complex I NDUFA9 subunit family protein [Rhodospirillaceae bacterium]|nr:complex I NDUFA9 subunit family protein [Rhodospirillaceae bacterium]OUT77179.1 MAG: hypothetical protein CBB83_08260 [Rhodospirillaceae bacterium TMED23]|tara:strand:- start:3207 stop:4205 length:999 start_codon:yes stop_codon:yes gene_type:complete
MDKKIVTVFGGSGFIGRHLIKKLADQDFIVRVAVRDPEAAKYLLTMGDIGQIVPIAASILDESTIKNAIKGVDSVVNLVGILAEWGIQSFNNLHTTGASNLAKASSAAGVKNFVHISALGANSKSASLYARTKAEGEQRVLAEFKEAVVLRPSVIFGAEDKFFNLFAAISRFTFFMPAFGCPAFPKLQFFKNGKLISANFYGDGGTKFQPVYVGDVAEAILTVIDNKKAQGNIYELGGPKVYTWVELMRLIFKEIDRKRVLVPIPFWYLYIVGWFLQKLPSPLLTCDQVTQLKINNIVSSELGTFKDLGLLATPVELIIGDYLKRFRKRNRR